MKKYLLFALCFISLGMFAQDRVNRTKLAFETEGVKLTNVTGWAYDSGVGEWVETTNVLEDKKQYAKYSNSPSWVSHKSNNIISLQFKSITCNGTHYNVLVWERWDGTYEYPNIQEDWRFWKSKMFLMFTDENMEKLRNLTNNPITISVPTPKTRRYDNAEDVDVIQTSMNRSYQGTTDFVIYKATDGSIRFLIQRYSFDAKIDKQYFEISEDEYIRFITL